MAREDEVNSWVGKIVQHFKGNKYLVLDIGTNSETEELMVIYKALYGECKVWIRPLKMFVEKCNKEQFDEYGQKYRFELLEAISISDNVLHAFADELLKSIPNLVAPRIKCCEEKMKAKEVLDSAGLKVFSDEDDDKEGWLIQLQPNSVERHYYNYLIDNKGKVLAESKSGWEINN